MDSALRPTSQIPQQPGVGSAKEQVASLSCFPCPLDVVQNPYDFAGRKIGGQGESSFCPEHVAAVTFLHSINDVLSPGVLPDNCVVDGLTGVLVPHNRGFSLVRNSQPCDVMPRQRRARQGFSHDLSGVVPNFFGVVLYPTGVRENLRMFALTLRHD